MFKIPDDKSEDRRFNRGNATPHIINHKKFIRQNSQRAERPVVVCAYLYGFNIEKHAKSKQ